MDDGAGFSLRHFCIYGEIYIMEEFTLEANRIYTVLAKLNFPYTVTSIEAFCREENGTPYDVWKIETDSIPDRKSVV